MKTYVGSSSESSVGVGTLLRFKESEVKEIKFDSECELGVWKVTHISGNSYYLYDLIALEPSGPDDIEEVDLEQLQPSAEPPPTLSDLKHRVLSLDPHDIVAVGLDSFSPYAYVDLPPDLAAQAKRLSDSDQVLFSEWLDHYLDFLADTDVSTALKRLEAEIQK